MPRVTCWALARCRDRSAGGESGIRTHGTLAGTRDFQSRLFVLSSISPRTRRPGRACSPIRTAWLSAFAARRWRTVGVAERVGFEPTMRLPPYRFSRPAPSASRPSLPWRIIARLRSANRAGAGFTRGPGSSKLSLGRSGQSIGVREYRPCQKEEFLNERPRSRRRKPAKPFR